MNDSPDWMGTGPQSVNSTVILPVPCPKLAYERRHEPHRGKPAGRVYGGGSRAYAVAPDDEHRARRRKLCGSDLRALNEAWNS